MRRRKQPRRAGLRLPETFRAAASSQALKHVPCSPLSTVHKCVAAEIPAPSLDTPHPTPTAQTYVSPQDSIPKFGFSTASNQPSAPPKILTSTPTNVTFHDLKTLKPQPPHPTTVPSNTTTKAVTAHQAPHACSLVMACPASWYSSKPLPSPQAGTVLCRPRPQSYLPSTS